jgi:uroporphyrinogen decarboxylase
MDFHTPPMMTSEERVQAAVSLKMPDRIPVFSFPFSISHRVYGCTLEEWIQDGELAGKSAIQYQALIGDDIVLGGLDGMTEAHGFGQEIIFSKYANPFPNFDNPLIKTPDDYFKLERYDPTRKPRTKELIKQVDVLANEIGSMVPVWACIMGPLETLCNMRPDEAMFKDFLKFKEGVRHAAEIITDVEQDLIKSLVKAGASLIYNCVSLGANTIMREKLWLEIEGSVMGRWADTVHECGARLALHNCSKGPYVQAQLNVSSPEVYHISHLPTDCRDWQEVKKKYGSRVCLQGYLNANHFGIFGEPQEMAEECRKQIRELGKDGGYILGSGCEYPSNASLLNAKAMVEAARLYGQYDGRGTWS